LVKLVLGIESTCDETACSVVREGKEILSSVIASQVDLQSLYGGVVPELACRRHIDVLRPVVEQAIAEASVTLADIDLVAVARGPGLIGAILIGLTAAKALAFGLGKPFIGVNHVEAHLYAVAMSHDEPLPFPALGVIVSGGHTSLVRMEGFGRYVTLGQTLDDAIGEAFDKVATLMGLPYPGGPQIERLARDGDPEKFPLKRGIIKGEPLSFSFSGLKTAVMYRIKGPNSNKRSETLISDEDKPHLAAAFQEAALGDVVDKALLAASQYDCQSIVCGGGVTHNRRLRELFAKKSSLPVYWPADGLSMDNAAMIAGLGYHRYQEQGCGDPLSLEAATRIPL
jgi:N6-L-threonylcarbamoyladenine synthase